MDESIVSSHEGLKDEVHRLREELTNFRAETNQRFDRSRANIEQHFNSVNKRFDTMSQPPHA